MVVLQRSSENSLSSQRQPLRVAFRYPKRQAGGKSSARDTFCYSSVLPGCGWSDSLTSPPECPRLPFIAGGQAESKLCPGALLNRPCSQMSSSNRQQLPLRFLLGKWFMSLLRNDKQNKCLLRHITEGQLENRRLATGNILLLFDPW